MNKIEKNIVKTLGFTLLIFQAFVLADVDIERAPTSMGTNMEIGQIGAGRYVKSNKVIAANQEIVTRLGVGFTEKYTINEILDVKLGVGGLFWWAFPANEAIPAENFTRFGPAITDVSATYRLGGSGESNNWIKLGFFGVKYNQDAANLGEYLYRSVPYPTILKTGGWVILNSSGYMAQGILAHFETLDGMLTHDVSLFMERDNAPMSDISPGYVANLKLGIFELSGGVSWYHALPIRPSLLEKNSNESSVVEFDNFPFAYNFDDTVHTGGPITGNRLGFLSVTDSAADSFSPLPVYQSNTNPNELVFDSNPAYISNPTGYTRYSSSKIKSSPYERKLWINGVGQKISITNPLWDPAIYTETDEYEYPREEAPINLRGLKFMLRAAVEFSGVRLFTETALLGVKNQPFFYENRSERMPIMFGLTFGIPGVFDNVNIQGEYFKNSFYPDLGSVNKILLPIWKLEGDNSFNHSEYHKDDFKWSIYLTRQIMEGFTLKAQVASDHMRLPSKDFQPSDIPLFIQADQFYYMLRVEFGI